MSDTILVTGGAGYIGRRLRQRLDDKHNIHSIDIVNDPEPHHTLYWKMDCRDESNLCWFNTYGVNHVYHLAGISAVGECEADPAKAYRQNVETTLTVARACIESGASLTFPSSQAVYGDSLYGATKAVCVDMLDQLSDATDLDVSILELSNVFGEYVDGDRTVSKRTVVDVFSEQARTGGPITVHEPGTQRRNFVHVDDVVSALDDAGDTTGKQAVVGPETISIIGLAQYIAEQAGVDVELVENDRAEAEDKPDPDAIADQAPDRYIGRRSVREYVDDQLSR